MSGTVSENQQAHFKPRVMLVDDEECIRETVRELLASEQIDARMDGLQDVVIDYITKPIEPSGFIAAVRKYQALLDQFPGTD